MKSIFFLSCIFSVATSVEIDTLEVVHITFRHGEKNPDMVHTYPTDPHKNKTIKPYTQGDLVNVGKQTMYELGYILRKKYGKFLGETYSMQEVEAMSSPFVRCKFSLQLVLASLFRPKHYEIWNKNFIWQPTLYDFLPMKQDKLFLNIQSKEYDDVYLEVCRSKKVQALLKEYEHILKYIRKHSGFNQECTKVAYRLFMTLDVEKEYGLELPKWTSSIYPQKLKEMVDLEYKIQRYTKKLQNILMGDFLRKILKDTENKINGASTKKCFLYSGHELNLVNILTAFGYMYPHIPGYGACIILEVHKIKNQHVLKIFYRDNKNAELNLLKNEHRDGHISLEDFKKIVRDISDNGDTAKSGSHLMYINALWLILLFLCTYVII